MTAKSTPLLLRNARSLTQFDWKLAEDYSPPALIVPILLLAENTFPGRGGGGGRHSAAVPMYCKCRVCHFSHPDVGDALCSVSPGS